MAYNILICDDEPVTCRDTHDILAEYGSRERITLNIRSFSSGEALYEYLQSDKYADLVFLDIELPMRNGDEIGNLIRDELHRNDIQIIYISSAPSHALKLFNSRPFDFIVKPFSYDKITGVFERYLDIYGDKNECYEYQYNKTSYRIPLSSILYFSSDNKQIHVITKDRDFAHYGRIRDLHGKYERQGFWSVHNSFIINVKYADIIKDNEIIMCNGDIIPVSRKYKESLKQNLLRLNEVT